MIRIFVQKYFYENYSLSIDIYIYVYTLYLIMSRMFLFPKLSEGEIKF